MMKKLITTQLALAMSLAMVLFAGNTKSTNKAANMDTKSTEKAVTNENVPPDDMMSLPFNVLVIRQVVYQLVFHSSLSMSIEKNLYFRTFILYKLLDQSFKTVLIKYYSYYQKTTRIRNSIVTCRMF